MKFKEIIDPSNWDIFPASPFLGWWGEKNEEKKKWQYGIYD